MAHSIERTSNLDEMCFGLGKEYIDKEDEFQSGGPMAKISLEPPDSYRTLVVYKCAVGVWRFETRQIKIPFNLPSDDININPCLHRICGAE